MKIIRKSTEKLLIDSFVRAFKKKAKKKEAEKKRLSFVLTGGPSPIKLYRELSKIELNWKNIDFFWGDERFVSKNSIHSNYNMAMKEFLRFIKIKKKQIYSLNTINISPKSSSKMYERKIKEYFKSNKMKFDIFLLGMGDDGHIASIFPKDLQSTSKDVTRLVSRDDFKRITINIKVINNSRDIYLWLNTLKKTKIYNSLKNIKKSKIPVNYLKKKNTTIFCIK